MVTHKVESISHIGAVFLDVILYVAMRHIWRYEPRASIVIIQVKTAKLKDVRMLDRGPYFEFSSKTLL